MSTPASNALTAYDAGHGKGFDLPEFTNLLTLRDTQGYDDKVLATLAAAMLSRSDKISDGPDQGLQRPCQHPLAPLRPGLYLWQRPR